MPLHDYKKKRDPAKTTEPFGPEPSGSGPTNVGLYVVHLHDATRTHYDLRIEIGGALASFAVPKGPSLDPESKHLAVNTEDHPLEYLDFEAVIPAGQYGGGPMILWDRGSVRYVEAPAEVGKANGKIDLHLSGYKLGGRYALVKLKKSLKQNEWLLFKKNDAFASKERDILAEQPRSVLSGLAIDELEKRPEIAKKLEEQAEKLGAKRGVTAPFEPVAIHAAAARPKGDDWVYEVKLDGVRVLGERSGDDAVLLHAGKDVTRFYPEVARALRALAPGRVIVDGDIVSLDDGKPSLARIKRRIEHVRAERTREAIIEAPVVYVLGDLLAVGDYDLRALPLTSRKEVLRALLRAPGILRVAEGIEGNLDATLEFARAHGLEGVVAKKKSSPYDAKHEKTWTLVRAEGAAERPAHIDHDDPSALPSAGARAPKTFTVTNRSKVFFPEDGYTKGDLCDYYEAIAPTLLPYLQDRPVALVRYPDGIHGKSFFQWNVPPAMPKWVKTLALRNEEDDEGERTVERRGFLVNDVASLVYIANLGAIPMHVLAWRTHTIDQADFFTMDFDVGRSTLANGIEQALTLRELLDAIGLTGFAKTSGQSGLHVLVPLGGASFDTAKTFAELLGRLVVQRHPKTATMERVVSKRPPNNVYVDTGQTGHGRAIVCAYSVRATPGATVSTPLGWDEVVPDLDPKRFTIKTVVDRVAKVGDPMRAMLETKVDVPHAVTKLRAMLSK